jgi:putative acyl-CoA dehydrogenase
MSSLDPFGYSTHEVLNQPPAMADYNAYSADPALVNILDSFSSPTAVGRLGVQ